MDWPADHHERRPTTALTPNPRNARTHSPEQVRQVADLITAHGWTMPILIDERDGIWPVTVDGRQPSCWG